MLNTPYNKHTCAMVTISTEVVKACFISSWKVTIVQKLLKHV